MIKKIRTLSHYKSIIIAVLIGIPAVLGTTYFWFSIDGIFVASGIKKSDWLSFWGSLLSTAGTVFLGWVAIKQNEKLQQLEESNFTINYASKILSLDSIEVNNVRDFTEFSTAQKTCQHLFEVRRSNEYAQPLNILHTDPCWTLELEFHFRISNLGVCPTKATIECLKLINYPFMSCFYDIAAGFYIISYEKQSSPIEVSESIAILKINLIFDKEETRKVFLALLKNEVELELQVKFENCMGIQTSTEFKACNAHIISKYISTLTKLEYKIK